jgi:hypothetical protein
MTEHIAEFRGAAAAGFCRSLIERKLGESPKSYSDISYWRDKSLNSGWADLIEPLDRIVRPCIESYLAGFNHSVSADSIRLRGFGLIRQPPGTSDDLHYDTALILEAGQIKLRPFVCLLYLNDREFSGGQLVFPAQKRVISPEAGKVILFPASYQFPHQVLGVAGGDRHFVRLNYMFDQSAIDHDIDNWDVTVQGRQRFS